MVTLKVKNWQDANNLYVELAATINGVYTTYTKDFDIDHNVQEAIDLCFDDFKNANEGNFAIEV